MAIKASQYARIIYPCLLPRLMAFWESHTSRHVCRSEEKQVEIEELRAEVRRGEQRLRTANRDMKSMQDKAELHSKFSTQYLAELEALRAQRQSPDKRRSAAPASSGNADAPPAGCG